MSGKIWCKHINDDMDPWLYHGPDGTQLYGDVDNWNFCPVCGKKKPEEPIPLGKILTKGDAITALDWFKNRIGHINVDTRTAIDLMQIFDEERRKCE